MNWLNPFRKKPNEGEAGEEKHSSADKPTFMSLAWQEIGKRELAEMPGVDTQNFTPRARQVLALAREETKRVNHHFVGTEHVLLGIIKLGYGTAFNVLLNLGLEMDVLRTEIEKQVGTGSDQTTSSRPPVTPRVKKVLALAAKEARTLNHTYVGTEHILLGLLREGDGVAARVLKNLDIRVDETRAEILNEINLKAGESPEITFDPFQETNQNSPYTVKTVWRLPSESHNSFTPRAQQVLALARKEADRLNDNFVGTEHVLLGLIKLGQGVAVESLKRHGLELDGARQMVVKMRGVIPQQKIIGNIPYTPRVKKVLSLAIKEAKLLNNSFVGVEHLLLGLLRENEGPAAKILREFKVELEPLRVEILAVFPSSPREDDSP